ncbi:MAG: BatA domain-containing protein, partial [Planctomycetaceae bacterium]|nr:BatA domain-containing protein [Planctomycetaceae bacterium]
MSFITFSLFFGGVIFAVVPVVLHLLMRGKPKRIEFPALVFIKKNLEVNRRSYRLKHILLLLLRVAAIVLFGLALSRPSLKYVDWLMQLPDFFGGANSTGANGNTYDFSNDNSWAGLGMQDAPVAAAIVVDSSLRMNYVAGNQSRLDIAKQFAQWILKRVPAKSEIAVLSTSRESAAFQVDLLAARDKIERMQTIPSGRAVVDVAADAVNLLAGSQNAQRELYIVTDLSEAGWSDKLAETLTKLVSNLRGQKNPNDVATNTNSDTNDDVKSTTPKQQSIFGNDKWLEIFIVDVSVLSPADTAIVNMKVAPQVVSPDTAVEIEANISNIGGATSRTIDLILFGDSDTNETIRDTKTVSFPAGESQRTVSFSVTGFSSGIHQGKIQFTVPDSLEFDDKMYFTVQVLPPPRIMIISAVPVRDTSLFLRQALVTVPFDVDVISFSELSGKTSSELNQFKALILLDPVPLDAVIWKKLTDFVSTGGGVGVFLGANAVSIASFNDPTASEIIGAKLVRHARSPDTELWLLPSNKSTPILTPFKQYGELERFPWDTQMVFRYWELGELSTRADIAMPFTDGRPAIITQTLGRGRTVTITTPVSETSSVTNKWNVLPNNDASWMFVLLMEGVAKYLTGSAEQRFIFNVGEPVVIRPAIEKMPETALLGMPDGKSIRLTPNTTQKEINIPATTDSGNFRIRSGGSQGSLDTGFSTNYNGDETNLRKINKEQLDRFFGENNYHLVRTTKEINQKISRRRVGMELYSVILLLLVIIFVTEY